MPPALSIPASSIPTVPEEKVDPWPDVPSVPLVPSTDRRRSPRPATARRPSIRPLLPSLGIFPWLARRFVPGEATVCVGSPGTLARFLELFYAGIAKAGGRVSLLEGANRFHPYRIGEAGRTLGVDPETTLDRIRLARAFTAYQMVALADGWIEEVRRHPPTVLVAHDVPALFETDELPKEERRPLLTHVSGALRRTVERARRPMLLALPGSPHRQVGLAEEGPRLHDVVRLEPRGAVLRFSALRGPERLCVVPRGAGQTGLESFGLGESPGEEVIGWAALSRRTGRRSRSG